MKENIKPKKISIEYILEKSKNQFHQKESSLKSASFIFVGDHNFLNKIKKVEPIVKEILKNKIFIEYKFTAFETIPYIKGYQKILKLLTKEIFYDYLDKISISEQKRLVSVLNKFNAIKMDLLFYKINTNVIIYEKTNKIISLDIYKIEKNLLKNKMLSQKHYQACRETYAGFLRALRNEALFTAKVNIDGEIKRIFIKGPIGSMPNGKKTNYSKFIEKDYAFWDFIGQSKLFIDPSSRYLDVYSFITDPKGKIIDYRRTYSLADPSINSKIWEYALVFKKELPAYLNRVYAKKRVSGIKRMKKTYNAMKEKPQKKAIKPKHR